MAHYLEKGRWIPWWYFSGAWSIIHIGSELTWKPPTMCFSTSIRSFSGRKKKLTEFPESESLKLETNNYI